MTEELLSAIYDSQEATAHAARMWSESQAWYFSNWMPEIEAPGAWWSQYAPSFQRFLPDPPARVLDIGSNNGSLVLSLRFKHYEAYGVDLPEVVERARKLLPSIAELLFPLNLEFDDLPGADYDIVLALSVMEHLVNWRAFLPKVARVMKPEAVFYMTSPNGRKAGKEHWHWRQFTLEELVALGAESGLVTIWADAMTASLGVAFQK